VPRWQRASCGLRRCGFFLSRDGRGSGAEGVVESADRLMSILSLVGRGVVLSFAAYLVGSFSVFMFSRPLLSLFRMSIEADTGLPTRLLDGLSELGRVSLTQVAADGRKRSEEMLALPGVGVDDVLGPTAPVADTGEAVADTSDKRAWFARRSRHVEPTGPSATEVLPIPEERQEQEIAERVLRDLPVVANAQLLGHEPEVFSAVDRSQAR
jgi:hypothetical protein